MAKPEYAIREVSLAYRGYSRDFETLLVRK